MEKTFKVSLFIVGPSQIKMLLKKCQNQTERKTLMSAFNMLIKPDEMGQRFKMMSIRKFDFKQSPPGFQNTLN